MVRSRNHPYVVAVVRSRNHPFCSSYDSITPPPLQAVTSCGLASSFFCFLETYSQSLSLRRRNWQSASTHFLNTHCTGTATRWSTSGSSESPLYLRHLAQAVSVSEKKRNTRVLNSNWLINVTAAGQWSWWCLNKHGFTLRFSANCGLLRTCLLVLSIIVELMSREAN
jgi:hypothetical protein